MTREACLPRRPQSQHFPLLVDARRVCVAGSMTDASWCGVVICAGFIPAVG